tara:strand:+ start:404 stop:556 length:153 start_codon:yes stop_codon:yes gene_type:complete
MVSADGFAYAMLAVGQENGTQKDLCIYQLIFYLKIKMNYPFHCIFHFHLF